MIGDGFNARGGRAGRDPTGHARLERVSFQGNLYSYMPFNCQLETSCGKASLFRAISEKKVK